MVRSDRGWQGEATWTRLVIAAFVLSLGVGTARAEGAKQERPATVVKGSKQARSAAYIPIEKPDGSQFMPMRRTSTADRMNAGIRMYERRQGAKAAPPAMPGPAPKADSAAGSSGGTGLRSAVQAVMRMALAQTFPAPLDYYSNPNYAYSKLPVATCSASATACTKDMDCPGYKPPIVVGVNIYPGGETCTGAVQSGGIRKFVDSLAPLCGQGLGVSTLNGQCIPIASADRTTWADADYYELGLKDFNTWQFHTDLGTTTRLRGYYQKNAPAGSPAASNAYLGPVIVAQTNRPIRVLFTNELPTGTAGDLFVPTDTVVEGAGEGPAGTPYTNNRAAIHLHGGNTPWISDGTQHQWTAPINQTSTFGAPFTGQDLKGWSVQDVPDMWYDAAGLPIPQCNRLQSCGVTGATNNPGPGRLTFYWTNQQSGRLMFYHDHAYGITRLNVHAGEAAGYLLVNPPDEDALAAATVPGTIGTKFFDAASTVPSATGADLTHMIPLVIQDKTFVPPLKQLAEQDPSWDVGKWGGEGSIWYPHVYTPNQWPDNPDGSGTNPWGHWDYGPWFWPAQNTLSEVNAAGQTINRPLTKPCYTSAKPSVGTDPITGQQLPNTDCPTTPDVSAIPESFLDTPVINGIAYPTLTVEPAAYRFQILNAAQERNWNLSWFVADATGTEVAMVPAVPHGTPGQTTASTTPPLCTTEPLSTITGLQVGPDVGFNCWPATWPVDSRQGGVPDPKAVGPKWIQIGSEAGILPTTAVIPPTPVGYEMNKRNIVVLNVAVKGLFMGPAERADVIVDFSAYAGKTLILYNDAPAPVPAGDTRLDPYTGDPDQTLSGGAPTTLPGYGPNIRTIMQVKVAASKSTQQPALDEAAIQTTLKQRFIASQPAPIVPEAAYSGMYGADYTNTYMPIQAVTSMTFTPIGDPGPGKTYKIQNKTIQELFTLNYGRMNSLLGVEIPTTNFQNQTTIPFDNYDPATDFFSDGEIQIWKITHNGVDTHTIHFHLVNLQIINRVGWDGQVRPPDANEIGWKESIRMNPLEDIYVALKPVKQNLPWPLPDKWRPMDVVRPLGTSAQFTQLDVFNQPIAVTNAMQNYGWEYVWHCHLLGHEEEDMLRAEVFVVPPEAPSALNVAQSGANANLSWVENSKSAMKFRVQRSSDGTFPAGSTSDFLVDPARPPEQGQIPGTIINAVDTSGLSQGATYYYRVRAEKTLTSAAVKDVQGGPLSQFTASSAWSNVAQLGSTTGISVSPQTLAFGSQLVNTASAAQSVTIQVNAAGVIGVGVTMSGTNPGDFAFANNCPATLTTVGTSCTIDVTFSPTASGARAATLAITTTDPVNPVYNVSLTGTGTAPIAGVNPTSLTFQAQSVNTTSAGQAVVLSNTGTAALTVSGISIAGTNAADFAATNTCIVAPATTGTVATASSCAITVAFTPKATGAKSARLVIASNDPAAPSITVALAGTGSAPVAVLSPTSLTFSNELLNTTSPAQTVTLSNTGTAPLTIGSILIGGAAAADYAIAGNTCAALATGLAAGASCTFGVTFTPSTTGQRLAAIAVSSNDPVNPSLSVALTGTVIAPAASVAPASLSFATQTVGTTSATQAVTLTNSGPAGATLSITSVAASGDFTATSGCGGSLAGGSACTINVGFAPTAAGSRTGTLTITSSDPLNPILTVALSGTGTAIRLSTSAVTFAGQLLGTTSPAQGVTITNAGTTALTVNAPTVSGANAADYVLTNGCGASLAGGASCAVSITFTPHVAGASSATLSINTNDPATPSNVTLSGTGTIPIASPVPAAVTLSTALNTTTTGTVTVTNTGTAPLTITRLAIGGTDANQFLQTSNCVGTFAVGGSCTITVTFAPTVYQGVLVKTATLTITASAPAANPDIPLTGTILVPTYTMAPSTLTFGKQPVGTTSAAQNVVVTNTSAAPLGIRGISIGGNSPGSFAQTNNCGTSLAANTSCTIAVTFTPTRTGTRTATLTLRAQQPAASTNVSLTGTGQ